MRSVMPVMEIVDEHAAGADSKRQKKSRGEFFSDGRYHMGPNEVLTIATGSGCLMQITADTDGQIREVNMCVLRDREVKVTLNGPIK